MKILFLLLFFLQVVGCAGVVIYPDRVKSAKDLTEFKCGMFKYVVSSESDSRIRRDSIAIVNEGIFAAIDECNSIGSKKEVLVTILLDDPTGENRVDGRTLISLPFFLQTLSILPIANDVNLQIIFHNTDSQKKEIYESRVFGVLSFFYLFFNLNFEFNKENANSNFYEKMKLAILNYESKRKVYEK